MKYTALTLLLLFSGIFASFAQNANNVRPFYDKKTIGEIRLTLPSAKWVDALDSMRIYGAGLLDGTVTVDGIKYENIGVRFRGDKSYQTGLKRNPFTIRLNYKNADQTHQGFSSIKLSSALRDPSMVREMLYYEIAGKYMPVPQTCYTKLYVNDEYIGVFINVESIDKQYLNTHFGSNSNAFFKAGIDGKPIEEASPSSSDCKQNIFGSLEYEENMECLKGNYDMISKEGWSDLQELSRVLAQDPANVEKVLDVDRALWMLALNNVMVNLHSYSGNYSVNYYLYKDNNGRFQVVPWDLNLSFGSYKNTGKGSDLELKDLMVLDPLLHSDNPFKPLINVLLKDPYYKKVYLSHIRQIVEENFSNGLYEKRAQEFQGMIVVPYNDDRYKLYSLDDFQKSLQTTVGKRSKIPGIVELMSRRAKFLKTHPELTPLPSTVSALQVQGRGKFENAKLSAFRITANADRFPRRMLVYYRFNEKSPYQVMSMKEEDAAGLANGVKSFSALIEAPNSDDAVLHYYLMAENAGAAVFFPANYSFKPNMVKLSELNK